MAKNPRKRTSGFTQAQIEDALRKSGGIHLLAAQQLSKATGKPCSRSNISHHVARHPELKEVAVDVKEGLKDIAEAKLIENIKAGQPASIFFFLKTQAKDRGYVERQEMTGKGGGPIESRTTLDLTKLTDNELTDLRRIAANAA